MLSTKLRILVEDAEARVVEAQQIGIENQARAERKESLLVAEKLLVKELQQSNNKLSYEIIPLREFTSLFCWIYKFFRKIRKYHD